MPLFSGGGVEEARGSRDALVRAAIKTYSKRAERLQDEREEARKQINIMRAQAQAEKAEAKRKQDDSAMWKGIFAGAGTGAQVGGAISPGWGHLIGGVAGAIGGGIWGAQDPESFYETAPIVAQAGQVAAQIGGEFRQKEYMDERMKMMDKWMSQGSGSAGVGAVSPTATGGAGTLQLGQPGDLKYGSKYTTPESTFGPSPLEFGGEDVGGIPSISSEAGTAAINFEDAAGRRELLLDQAMKKHSAVAGRGRGDARSEGMAALAKTAGITTAEQQQQADALRRSQRGMMAGSTMGQAVGSVHPWLSTAPRQPRGMNYLTLGNNYTGLLPDYMQPLPTPFTGR